MKPSQIPELQNEDPYTYEDLIRKFCEMSISFYQQEQELEKEIELLKKSKVFQVRHPVRALRLFLKRIKNRFF